ncbi:hypothetical protein OPQ81_009651 [Rhizoctonia solani]|nr:hypothetical protein OPQ81_009651 [Rhizoctonia solani]
MFSRAFALIAFLSVLVAVLANPAQKRQDPIQSIISEASTGFGGATSAAGTTSAAGSLASEATSAAASAFTQITSAGGSIYTLVTAQGTYYSIATNAAGSAYSVALSAAASATSRALESNAATQGLRPDWIMSFPLLTALVAVAGGVFMGAVAVF